MDFKNISLLHCCLFTLFVYIIFADLASAIRRHVSQALRQRKGSVPCYYISELATYTLPPGNFWNFVNLIFIFLLIFFSPNFVEIEDLPPTIQEQLYSELMDRDAQKELEEEAAIINWSEEVRVRNKYFVKLKITVITLIVYIYFIYIPICFLAGPTWLQITRPVESISRRLPIRFCITGRNHAFKK